MILHDNEVPAELLPIRDYIAERFGASTEDILIGDAAHEGQSEGCYSIALEGCYEWPMWFLQDLNEGKVQAPKGWGFDCLTGWALSAYPDEPFEWPEHMRRKD